MAWQNDVSNVQSMITRKALISMDEYYEAYKKKHGKQPDRIPLEYTLNNWNYVTRERWLQMRTWAWGFERVYGSGSAAYIWIKCPQGVIPNGKLQSVPKPQPIVPERDEYWNPRYLKDHNIVQDTIYWCSCNTTQQVLYELYGVVVPESELARDMGTTTQGSSHDMITRGIKMNARERGYKEPEVEWLNFSEVGWKRLGEGVADPDEAWAQHTIYRRKYGHYEAIAAVLMDRKIIVVPNSLSGGYMEYRSFAENESYMALLSQPSLLRVVKK